MPAGQSVITATATDPVGNTSEFSKCVAPDNGDPPQANADSYAAAQDTPLTVPNGGMDLLANGTDPDGDTLTAAKSSDSAHGSVTVNADGSFTYTPTAGFSGPDSFTYRANDGTFDSNPATVAINVAGSAADPPPTLTGAADQTAVTATAKTFDLGSFHWHPGHVRPQRCGDRAVHRRAPHDRTQGQARDGQERQDHVRQTEQEEQGEQALREVRQAQGLVRPDRQERRQ